MNILVAGESRFNDYHTFIRGVGVAIDEMLPRDEEGKITPEADSVIRIYSAGPAAINSFTASFANMSEDMLRGMGFKIKFHKYPYRVSVSNLTPWDISRVVVFGFKNLHTEPVAVSAGLLGIKVNSYV